jgi:hypothetical protein
LTRRVATTLLLAGLMPAALPACQPQETQMRDELRHEGVETLALSDDIVSVTVRMSGPAAPGDVIAYARCGMAGYAVAEGFGFARHVRTNLQVEGGVRIADAVYTLSPTRPRGLQTIEAEATLADCAEQGIPTV